MNKQLLIILALFASSAVASPVLDVDRVFDIDVAPLNARGKSLSVEGRTGAGRKYTDVAGLYTFLMPTGWRMEAVQDEPPGVVFKGIHRQHPVNCAVNGKDYRRGPKTLAELQELPETKVRASFEPILIADTGWKSIEGRSSLSLGESGKGKLVKAWTWFGLAPDGKTYDTIAIVETPAALLLVVCGSSNPGQTAAEDVIRRYFRVAEGALISPATITPVNASKSDGEKQFQEAMRAWNRGDYEAARMMLLPLAEQGNGHALNNLGVMHEKGYGVTKDDAEAAKWYLKAAELGNLKAQFTLGVMHANGRGVANDEAQASAWYLKAAQQGHAEAQYNMGLRYVGGRGVAQNPTDAAGWYRKSAEQGYARAQVNLGLMYAKGEGVTKDDAEAVKWYRKSAEQGNAIAQNNLSVRLHTGQGVDRDVAAAAMWLLLAAEGGDKSAPLRLPKLEQELGAEQMAQARQRASECKAKEFKGCQ